MSDIDSQPGSTAAVMQRPPDRAAAGGVVALLGIDPAQLAQIDADKLEKLVGLFERHAARQAAEEYARAMREAQQEMQAVVRDTHSDQTNRKYAPLETVHRAVKPVWLKHGFSLSFGDGKPDQEGQCKLVCDVFHVGGHSTRHFLEGALDSAGIKGGLNKTAIQAKVSSSTYLRRCLEVLIFDLTIVDADKDGAPAAPAIVGDLELRIIRDLFKECQDEAAAYGAKFTSKERFLAWLHVPALDQLPMTGFAKAVEYLDRKRREIKETPKP